MRWVKAVLSGLRFLLGQVNRTLQKKPQPDQANQLFNHRPTMPFTEIPFDLSLLASAVEATDTSFVIADHALPDNPIIFCNNAFERLTGYCREEIIGKNCRFLQGPTVTSLNFQNCDALYLKTERVMCNYAIIGRMAPHSLMTLPCRLYTRTLVK